MRGRFIAFFLMLLSFAGNAQTSVTAKLDSAKSLVGSTVTLELKVVHPEDVRVFWPVISDSLGGVDVIASTPADTQRTSGNMLLLTKTYQLMAFDSGKFVIPGLQFNAKSARGENQYVTEELALEVFYVPVDTTKAIRDIAPLVEVPYDWKLVILILLTVVVLAALAWFLYKRYLKNKQAVIPEITGPVVPLHESTLAELEALRASGLWQKGRVKEYYTELTDILRRYITARWNLNAMELTSDEILSAGFMKMMSTEDQHHLNFILRTADLVKFAKATPIAQDHENSWMYAVTMVKSSIPVITAAPEEEVKA